MKPVAVIILNWNGVALLEKYLPDVIANTDLSIADIIVADNGSTDSSVEFLKSRFPQVGILPFDSNHGFAGGYNLALAETGYRYTVLLNSDVSPMKGWLNPLYDFMEENGNVAAVQPKIRSLRNRQQFEHAGASGGFIDINGYPYCRGRVFTTVETDNGQYDDTADIFWASGAALMVRTDLYKKAGGLDEDFFAHMEEIDLCWRLQLMGYRICVVPKSVVMHLGGASLDYSDPRKTYLNFRNNLLMLHKNLPDTTRCRKLLVRRLLDTIAWIKYVVTLDFADASAIWRAHRDFAKMSKKYTSHPSVDLLAKMPDRRNILIDYYVRGKKTYR